MKEYVYGTDQNYDLLEKSLEDHMCHVQNGCQFPRQFSQSTGRIGFEKEETTYALFIDKGITCFGRVSELLQRWLDEGVLRFLDFPDLKEFLRSLKFLY